MSGCKEEITKLALLVQNFHGLFALHVSEGLQMHLTNFQYHETFSKGIRSLGLQYIL